MLAFLQHQPAPRTSRARLARERGAILVEAAIVIAALTLGLMGLMFFRAFYIKQLTASRLARASVLAHSMVGCNGSQPRDWIGRRDLANLTAANPGAPSNDPAVGQNQTTSASSSGTAGNVLSKLGGVTGDGKGVLNPITDADLTGHVSLSSGGGLLSQKRTVFESNVHSKSFVSCGERVREGNVKEVLRTILGDLGGLL